MEDLPSDCCVDKRVKRIKMEIADATAGISEYSSRYLQGRILAL